MGERKLDTSHHLNAPIEAGHDEDLLTKQELLEYGYRVARKRHKQEVARRCSDCKRVVAEPVTAYEWEGISIMQKGEILHAGCLTRRKNAILKLLKKRLETLKTENV